MNTSQKDNRGRVLVVVSNPLGGIRTYLLYNLPLLMESGYVFTFIAPDGEAFETFKQDVQSWPGVEFIAVPARGRRFSLRTAVRRALRTGRFSVIHSQGLRAGTETAFANLGVGIPHFITLHDIIVPQNDIPGRFKWLKKRLIGRLTSRANVIIPVSHDCAENHVQHFPEWKRGRCRIEVILNGVNVQQLIQTAEKVDKNALRKELGFSADVTMLGFFGRFMPQKGFFVLLDALHDLAQRGFVDRIRLVATKDQHGYRGEYMREVKKDKTLSQMVRFIEPVSEIAIVLPQIDILVMPSLWEACPLLPMEAMVLGVPVVGSDAIGLREVLRDTPSLAPAAGDAAALASAIEKTRGAASRQQPKEFAPKAGTRFDNYASSQKMRQIYDALCR